MTVKIHGRDFATCEMSDFYDMMKYGKGVENLQNDGKEYLERAKRVNKYDNWAEDPDFGTSYQRCSGDFAYATELMKKTKIDLDCGNIASLQPSYEFGLLTGTEVDFDSYMRHDPRCLGKINMPITDDGDRIMRVAIGIGGNCGISADELIKRAARVLKVVETYAEAGYGIEVYAMYAGQRSYGSMDPKGLYSAVVDCSRATPGQIIGAMSSAKVFRSLVFSLLASLPDRCGGLGYPINHTQNPQCIPLVDARMKELFGNNLRIIHAGADEKQIKEALK